MTKQGPPQEAIVTASATVASVAASSATASNTPSGFTLGAAPATTAPVFFFGVPPAASSNTASGFTLSAATGTKPGTKPGAKPSTKPITKPSTKPGTKPGTTTGGALENKFSMLSLNFWDPISFEHEESSPQCRMRTKRDIMDIYAEPPPGVYIAPEEHNITKIHALLLGPADTPYEGGFFHFLIQCPPDYPIQPPRVRLMTTDAGRVRFNPNLYENGKVCLSILGTWDGPAWSPAQCIASVLISIQSLLTENPYYNEPGFETERRLGDSKRYNLIVQHETIRVAVCDAVEACLEGRSLCPPTLRAVMLNAFPDYYDKYEQVVKSNMDLTGARMFDPFGARRGLYQYETLLKRLQKLEEGVRKWLETPPEQRE